MRGFLFLDAASGFGIGELVFNAGLAAGLGQGEGVFCVWLLLLLFCRVV